MTTGHAILDIVCTCLDNIETKDITGLLLIDLAKAFDTVQHEILLEKLQHYGNRGVVNQFFRSYPTEINLLLLKVTILE